MTLPSSGATRARASASLLLLAALLACADQPATGVRAVVATPAPPAIRDAGDAPGPAATASAPAPRTLAHPAALPDEAPVAGAIPGPSVSRVGAAAQTGGLAAQPYLVEAATICQSNGCWNGYSTLSVYGSRLFYRNPRFLVGRNFRMGGGADFTRDSMPDLVLENTDNGDRWIVTMQSFSGLTPSSWISIGNIPREWRVAAAADLDGDGQPEILWDNTATGQRGYYTMSGPRVTGWVNWGFVNSDIRIIGVGDFTGDGQADVALYDTFTRNLWLWRMQASVPAEWLFVTQLPANLSPVGVGDFSGDGRPDIAAQDPATREIFAIRMNGAAFSALVSIGPSPTEAVSGGGPILGVLPANKKTGVPLDARIVAGNDQEVYWQYAVKVSPRVRVADFYQVPVPGSPVTFAIQQGENASVLGGNQLTDLRGEAAPDAWVLGWKVETNYLNATIGGNPNVTLTRTFSATPGSVQYDYLFFSSATTAVRTAFTGAVQRWATYLRSGVPDHQSTTSSCGPPDRTTTTARQVDDFFFLVDVGQVDGTGNMVAMTYPCGDPYAAYIRVDAADLSVVQNAGRLEDVLAHEIGHALAFNWRSGSGVVSWERRISQSDQDPQYADSTGAVRGAWQALGGSSPTVPVQPLTGFRSDQNNLTDAHWRGSGLPCDLMSPMTSTTLCASRPLSRLTLSVLDDIGWVVDYSGSYPLTTARRP